MLPGKPLFPEPLINWSKYQIEVQGRTIDAWFINGQFTASNYMIFKPEDIDCYCRIVAASELWGKRCSK